MWGTLSGALSYSITTLNWAVDGLSPYAKSFMTGLTQALFWQSLANADNRNPYQSAANSTGLITYNFTPSSAPAPLIPILNLPTDKAQGFELAGSFPTTAPEPLDYSPVIDLPIPETKRSLRGSVNKAHSVRAARHLLATQNPLPNLQLYVDKTPYIKAIPLSTFDIDKVTLNFTLSDGSPLPSWFNYTAYPARSYGSIGNTVASSIHRISGSVFNNNVVYVNSKNNLDIFNITAPGTLSRITTMNVGGDKSAVWGVTAYFPNPESPTAGIYIGGSGACCSFGVDRVGRGYTNTLPKFIVGSDSTNRFPSLNDYYVAADTVNKLYVVDVSTDQYTMAITSTINSINVAAMDLQNHTLAVAEATPSLKMFKINPSGYTLTAYGSIPLSAAALSVKVNQNYVYIGSNNGLQIIDISNITNPLSVGSYSTQKVNNIDVDPYGQVYLNVNNQQILALDVRQPSSPALLATYATTFGGTSSTPGFAVKGQRIFYGAANTLNMIDAQNGNLTYHGYFTIDPPLSARNLTYTINATAVATDGSNAVLKTQFRISVLNRPPVISKQPAAYSFNIWDPVNIPLNLTADVTDADLGDVLSYQLLPDPRIPSLGLVTANGTAGNASHILTGVVGADQQGAYNASIQVTDSLGLSALYKVSLTIINRYPYLNDTAFNLMQNPLTWRSNQSYSFNLPNGLVADNDLDMISFNSSGILPYMNFNGSTLSGTVPLRNQWAGNLNFTANDGHGGTLNFSIPFINPNEAPVITKNLSDFSSLTNLQFYAGPLPSIALPTPSSFVYDANGDDLSAVVSSNDPSKLSLTLNTTAIPWTIGGQVLARAQGIHTLTVSISDGKAEAVNTTFNLRVFNTPPQLATISNKFWQVGVPIADSYSATDNDGDALTTKLVVSGTEVTIPGVVVDDINQKFAGTLSANAAGSYFMALRVTDPEGGTAVQSFPVTVSPSLLVFFPEVGSYIEDNPYSIPPVSIVTPLANNIITQTFTLQDKSAGSLSANNVTGNATSVYNAQSKELILSGLPAELAHASVNFTPQLHYFDSVDVKVKVEQAGGYNNPLTQTLTIGSTPTFDPISAKANPASLSLSIGQASFYQLDSDGLFNNFDKVAMSFMAQLQGGLPLKSWMSFANTSFSFNFDPQPGQQGSSVIEIIGMQQGNQSNNASVFWPISVINRRPVVLNGISSMSIGRGRTLNVTLPGPGDSFTDQDGDSDIRLLNVTGLSSNMFYDPLSRRFIFTPDSQDASSNKLTATAIDSVGATASTVFSANVDDSFMVNAPTQTNFIQGQPLSVPIGIDTPGGNLTVSFTSDNLNNGRMQLNATIGAFITQQGNTLSVTGPTLAVQQCLQSLTFIPGEYFRGVVRFSCRARDGINPDKQFNMEFDQAVDVSHNLGTGIALPELSTTSNKATSFQIISSTDPINTQAHFISYDFDPLQYSIQILQNGTLINSSAWSITVNQNSGQVNITPPPAHHGDYQVKVIAQAMSNNLPIANKTAVLVTGLNIGNTVPTLSQDPDDISFRIGINNTAILPIVTDADGDSITFALTDSNNNPITQNWLLVYPVDLSKARYALSGIPPAGAPSLQLKVSYTDNHGGIVERSFKVNMIGTLLIHAPDQIDFTQGQAKAVPVSIETASETLTVSFTSDNLNNGRMQLDASTEVNITQQGNTLTVAGPTAAVNQCLESLRFVPSEYFRGVVRFTCRARDGLNSDAQFIIGFAATVEVSHDLGIASALPILNTTPNKAANFQIISTTDPINNLANFISYDGDTLQYSLQILQDARVIDTSQWHISINQNSGRVSITPPPAHHGDYQVKVIAQAMANNLPIANKTAELVTILSIGNTAPLLNPDQISDKSFNIGRNNTAILPIATDADGDSINFELYDSNTGERINQNWLQVQQAHTESGWQYSLSGRPPVDAPDSMTLQASYSDGNGGLVQRSFKLNIISSLRVSPMTGSDTMQQASTEDDTYLTVRQVSSLGNEPVRVSITYDQTFGSMKTRTLSEVNSSLAQASGFATWQVSGAKGIVNQHLALLQFFPNLLIKGPGKTFFWNVHNGIDRDADFSTNLNISPINLPPAVHDSIPPIAPVTEGKSVVVSFSRTYFSDPDNLDTELRWLVTHADNSALEPDWAFDSDRLTLMGTVYHQMNLKITVTDPDGRQASQMFTIPYQAIPPWYVTFNWSNLSYATLAIPAYIYRRVIASQISRGYAAYKQQPFTRYPAITRELQPHHKEMQDQLIALHTAESEANTASTGIMKAVSAFNKMVAHTDEDDLSPPKEVSQEDLAKLLDRITRQFTSGSASELTLQLIRTFKTYALVFALTHTANMPYLELEVQKLILEYSGHIYSRLKTARDYGIITYAKLKFIRVLADFLLLTETANKREIPYEYKLLSYFKLADTPDFKVDDEKARRGDKAECMKLGIKFELKAAMASLACAPDNDFFLFAIPKKRATVPPVEWYANILRIEGLLPFAKHNTVALNKIIDIHRTCKPEDWHVKYAAEVAIGYVVNAGGNSEIKAIAAKYLKPSARSLNEPLIVVPATTSLGAKSPSSGRPLARGSMSAPVSARAAKIRKGSILSQLGNEGLLGDTCFTLHNPMQRANSAGSSTSHSNSPGSAAETAKPESKPAQAPSVMRRLVLDDDVTEYKTNHDLPSSAPVRESFGPETPASTVVVNNPLAAANRLSAAFAFAPANRISTAQAPQQVRKVEMGGKIQVSVS
ncbi:MAG: Ig family protein [Gammaproteobacteria bacterium]|nr:Ig family protein [Gammaproteobacteria bacterium]